MGCPTRPRTPSSYAPPPACHGPAGPTRGARRSLGRASRARGRPPHPPESRSWHVADAPPARCGRCVEALRPAWWVLRAWVAVSLLDAAGGPAGSTSRCWPTLGVPLLGPVLLLVAVVVSVRVGQGSSARVRPRPVPAARGWSSRGSTRRVLASLSVPLPRRPPYALRSSMPGGSDAGPRRRRRTGRSATVPTWSATSTPTTPRDSRSRASSSSTRGRLVAVRRGLEHGGRAGTGRSPVRGSTARRRSSTSSRCRSVPSARHLPGQGRPRAAWAAGVRRAAAGSVPGDATRQAP